MIFFYSPHKFPPPFKKNKTMDRTSTPASSNPMENTGDGDVHQQQQRWSFKRFGADAEAQATVSTWDEIYRSGQTLFEQVDSRKGELYEAETMINHDLSGIIAGLPHPQNLHSLRKHIRSTMEGIKGCPVTETIDSASVGGEDEQINVSVSREEWDKFRELVNNMDHLSTALVRTVLTTSGIIKNTQKSLRTLDSNIKEFIATVWSINAERTKAFPPFFTDLGPLHASVYGLGCMTTQSTTKTPSSSSKSTAKKRPASSSSSSTNNPPNNVPK